MRTERAFAKVEQAFLILLAFAVIAAPFAFAYAVLVYVQGAHIGMGGG